MKSLKSYRNMATSFITQILAATLTAMLPAIAAAQEANDSIATQELSEIVVEAPKVIHKSDMDLYHPSKSAVDNSRNGMQLLRNLMIPALSVNEALGTISAAGQAVQVRINGRLASVGW